jgi:hypothetical protein
VAFFDTLQNLHQQRVSVVGRIPKINEVNENARWQLKL